MAMKRKASDKLKGCTLSAKFRAEENQFVMIFTKTEDSYFVHFASTPWTGHGGILALIISRVKSTRMQKPGQRLQRKHQPLD